MYENIQKVVRFSQESTPKPCLTLKTTPDTNLPRERAGHISKSSSGNHFEKIFEVPERCVTIHTTKDRDRFLFEMGVCKIEDEDMMDENRLDLGGALILRVRGVRA